MATGESAAHLELKRLALVWAQANGYPIAATEVSLPDLRFRLDAASYRPGSVKLLKFDDKRGIHRHITHPSIGLTSLYECKANRADLVRDCRLSMQLLERIRILGAARIELEARLRIQCPSLLNGDSLWPEYETADFDRSDDPDYRKTIRSLRMLQRQVHGQTKMEKLIKWNAANLHYLVVEPGIIAEHEVPAGWGLLVRNGTRLDLRLRPEFKDIPEVARLAFLHRVAAAGTKAANRQFGVSYPMIEAERRGMEYAEPEAGEPTPMDAPVD